MDTLLILWLERLKRDPIRTIFSSCAASSADIGDYLDLRVSLDSCALLHAMRVWLRGSKVFFTRGMGHIILHILCGVLVPWRWSFGGVLTL